MYFTGQERRKRHLVRAARAERLQEDRELHQRRGRTPEVVCRQHRFRLPAPPSQRQHGNRFLKVILNFEPVTPYSDCIFKTSKVLKG
jgi:hypothetical protein